MSLILALFHADLSKERHHPIRGFLKAAGFVQSNGCGTNRAVSVDIDVLRPCSGWFLKQVRPALAE